MGDARRMLRTVLVCATAACMPTTKAADDGGYYKIRDSEYARIEAAAREILERDPQDGHFFVNSPPTHTGWFTDWGGGSTQSLDELSEYSPTRGTGERSAPATQILDEAAHKAAVK